MSALTVKLRRDLRRRPGQLVSVMLLVLLGVALYGASYDAYQNLDAGYQAVFERDHFADITLVGGDTDAIAASAAATEGVAAVNVRTVVDVPMRLSDGSTLTGRVVGLPDEDGPVVNDVGVENGRYPVGSSAVLAEKHLADQENLSDGSTVEVWRDGAWQTLTVTGTASSAEYLWPAASRQDILPAPGSFGVLFAPEQTAQHIAGAAGVRNQVCVYYTDAAREDADSLDSALAAMARDNGATDAVTRADQPSNAALSEDIEGFAELAVLFPLLFLTAAGLTIYVVLTRRVTRDRVVIGMMRASGFRRRTIAAHYVTTGLLVGTVGAVAGVLLGIAAAGLVTRLYTGAIGVPITVTSVRIGTIVSGLAFGIIAGALSALAPALAASRVPPAEAMRGTSPPLRGGRGVLARLEALIPATRKLPAGVWLVLRGPTRNLKRTLYTEAGVILALVLILVSWGMMDSLRATLAKQFDQVQLQDAQVVLASDTGDDALAAIKTTPGVAATEPMEQFPVTVGSGSSAYATSLIGLRTDTKMHGFVDDDGEDVALPDTGVLLGTALQDRLGVDVGDSVSLLGSDGKTVQVEVAGFVSEPLGAFAYASLAQASALGTPSVEDIVLLKYTEDADRDDVRAAVSSVPGVVSFTDSRALRDSAEDLMNLFYVFVGVMLVFGGLLAFTMLLATMSVNLAERGVEAATLRANGVSRRRLSRLVTAENLLLVVVGIVPGLILGWLASAGFLAAFDSDLFAFETSIRPSTFALSALAIVIVALLAQIPGLRALHGIDLAATVRERAG